MWTRGDRAAASSNILGRNLRGVGIVALIPVMRSKYTGVVAFTSFEGLSLGPQTPAPVQ